MAKNRKRDARPPVKSETQETRKLTVKRRRDAERKRRLLVGLGAVGALLILILVGGLIQELVIVPGRPVAKVDAASIPAKDYKKRVLFNWLQSNNQVTDPQGTSLQVMDQMVDEELLREQAKQRGIVVSPDEITAAIEKSFGYQRTPPTPTPTPEVQPTPGGEPTATPQATPTPVSLESYQKEYKDYLKRLSTTAGMSEADFRALVEIDLLRQKLYDAVTADVPKTEEEVHARHILVRIIDPQPTPTAVPAGQPTPTPDPNATPTPEPRNADQALARIIEVKQKLDAGGDFAALAKEYSDDTGSASQGGDLGWFGRGRMVTEFEDAAFKLQPGQVSDPVKTSFGYHLIKVEERDPARPMDEYTLSQKKYEFFTTWLTDLRNAAKVERNWSLSVVPPTPSAVAQ